MRHLGRHASKAHRFLEPGRSYVDGFSADSRRDPSPGSIDARPELGFFGAFEWDGTLALLAGIIAVWAGWRRNDWTVWLGLVAISYVVLAQSAQSLWDSM